MTSNIEFPGLRDLPLGDFVFVQGSIVGHVKHFKRSRIEVMQCLLDFLRARGYSFLVVPAFTFSVFSTRIFYQNLRAEMGYISRFVEMQPSVVRTSHPMYSFYLLPLMGGQIPPGISLADNRNCFGPESFYSAIDSFNPVQVCLGLPDRSCMTFYHQAERLAGMSHRFEKEWYVSRPDLGADRGQQVSVYVRKEGVKTNVDGMEQYMWKTGTWHGIKPGDGGPNERWCLQRKCVELVCSLRPEDGGLLYETT